MSQSRPRTAATRGFRRALPALLLLLAWNACSPAPPTPRSDLLYLPPDLVEWIWSGAVTPTSAVVKARFKLPASRATLRVHPRGEDSRVTLFPVADWSETFQIGEFRLDGLAPDTEYIYRPLLEEREETLRAGTFRTLPEAPTHFRIAFGACAETGSSARVFETIERLEPLVFIHLGDLHYLNIRASAPEVYLAGYSQVLASPAQSALYRSTPIAYMWDDHDYGPDNSDRTHPGREASSLAYRLAVPHYALQSEGGAIYQAFTIGKVRFVMTDNRYERDPLAHESPRSLLGQVQKEWFKGQARSASASGELLVWVNSVPWIGSLQSGGGWGGFREERAELTRFLEQDGMAPVVILGGDAHMLAIDDGSHSNYGSHPRGFPVFHAASLDRNGSVKGGPYSHGTLPGGGFFGVMEVSLTASSFDILWSGRNWQDRELLSYRFSVPRKPAPGGSGGRIP